VYLLNIGISLVRGYLAYGGPITVGCRDVAGRFCAGFTILSFVCATGGAAFSKAALFSGHFEGWFAALWRSSHSSSLSGGRLSDMANLAWAKNAVLVVAVRDHAAEAAAPRKQDPIRAVAVPSQCRFHLRD